ncbi:glutamate racemase [Trichothermofontia sp.]
MRNSSSHRRPNASGVIHAPAPPLPIPLDLGGATPQQSASRIGLFDSGLGGLTVLREVQRQLPQESVLYFADTARLPYGTRSPEEILQFVREILTWMQRRRVKMVIMACNTSSALALETVQAEFDMPILGLILPGARAAVQQAQRIGVIATPATAASGAYGHAIREIDPTAQVWQIGCPEFVPLIEQNRLDDPYTYQVAQQYLAPLLAHQIDGLIYGCTHYPLLEPILRQILPPSVQLINPAQSLVAAAAQELDALGLTSTHPALPPHFCVSGDAQAFSQAARRWLGTAPPVEAVTLPRGVPSQIGSQIGSLS